MVVDGEVQADIGPVGAFVSFVVAWTAHRSGMAWWEIADIRRYCIGSLEPKLRKGGLTTGRSVQRKGVNAMKTLLSIFALTLALAFTGPAFAGDVTAAKTEADCAKAGGTWNATTKMCEEKKM